VAIPPDLRTFSPVMLLWILVAAAGAVAFFQKPFDEKDLLGAIYNGLNLNNT
jgi:FixJ family two-component response regulator